ncbi:hypothetical protein NLJ89_g9428 [Agrocybe chaxingu]|uniref:Uncharacterized protein n=1 Tax=Agrocybe chaxingu TaxID=84603 RepID=A0A9W8MRU5_9AGAR|nr:hypothetical protein NLJ89_g9428 [Agrocybe chaxingu]
MSEKEGSGHVSMVEDVNRSAPANDMEKLSEPGSPERVLAERKLIRKLDMRLLPTIFLIYIMNYIDRNGVTTARLKGMQEDLRINDVQYATVIAILFASYCPAQIPSNMELALRSAILYAGLLISNAFGALMAAGILANMEGKRGIRAWRWLFFIEGAITIVVGLGSMSVFYSLLRTHAPYRSYIQPHNTRWMNASELRLAQARLSEDAGEADKDNAEDSQWQGLILAVKDPKVLIFALMSTSQLLGLSFVNFFPTLTQTLGFNTTVTLLLAAPPWILSSIICCLNAWHADKTGERFFHIAGWWWGVILGFVIALSTMSIAGRYVSLFLMAFGFDRFCYDSRLGIECCSAATRETSCCNWVCQWMRKSRQPNGLLHMEIYMGPKYHQSMGISLGALVISTVLSLIIRQMLVHENRTLDEDEKAAMEGANRARVEEAARLEGITFEEAMERRKGYRYLY